MKKLIYKTCTGLKNLAIKSSVASASGGQLKESRRDWFFDCKKRHIGSDFASGSQTKV